MSAPLSWRPNNKSRIGLRSLSRTPRTLRHPPWSTTPPIAEGEPMGQPQPLQQTEDALTKMRRVLRGMVLVVTDANDEQARSKLTAMLENTDDVRLAALGMEALANFQRLKSTYDKIDVQMRETKKSLEALREGMAAEERALASAKKAIEERDDIAAKYKELKQQLDPEKQQLEIMYAIDEATKTSKEELANVRRELMQRKSEVDELRESKRRLRKALDAATGKD